MSQNQSLILLIAKAGQIVGSEYRLAKELGINQQVISAWKAGTRTCTPADRARLAGFAGEDAVQELVRATIESASGTKKEQLQALMGKWLHETGEALVSIGVAVTSLIFAANLADIPRCIEGTPQQA